DRREVRAADAAEARDREGAALEVGRLQLAVARDFGNLAELAREIEHPFAIGIAHHGYDEPARRVDRNPDVVVVLDDDVLARLVERGVELREARERSHA